MKQLKNLFKNRNVDNNEKGLSLSEYFANHTNKYIDLHSGKRLLTTPEKSFLDSYITTIQQVRQPFTVLQPTKSAFAGSPCDQSKYGGMPYVPKHVGWPRDPEDNLPLYCLCQINFSEMPSLPHFPEEGILQFWVDCILSSHQLIFYEKSEIDLSQSVGMDHFSLIDEEIKNAEESWQYFIPFDVYHSYPINFHAESLPSSTQTMQQAEERLSSLFSDKAALKIFKELYCDIFPIQSIGGYPVYSLLDDVHTAPLPAQQWVSLLEIAQGSKEILWCDGIDIGAAFMISIEDLKNRDFSQVRLQLEV